MKAIVIDTPGEEGVMRLGDAPEPVAGPEEVLIDVEATSVNRADLYQRQGKYPPPTGASAILGLDAAGTVREVGARVRRFRAGDHVMALLPGGGYAERVVAHHGSVMRVPAGWSMEEAAAFPEVYLTAFLNIFRVGAAREGETLLMHGGLSGVGTAAVQLAREAGLRVIVTVGSPDRVTRALDLGADAAFDYHDDWAAAVAALGPVDVILDPIGARYLEAHLALLATGGRLVAIGGMGGVRRAEIDWPTLMSKRISLTGSTLRARSVEEKGAIVLDLEDRFGAAIAEGHLKPVVDQVFPLAEAPEAHRRMAASEHVGKIVLRVSGTD
ncbi:MAG TPA: NAD(P)H-quinone oxidoreductase [Candidatus Eisenbacteria bacterium]